MTRCDAFIWDHSQNNLAETRPFCINLIAIWTEVFYTGGETYYIL